MAGVVCSVAVAAGGLSASAWVKSPQERAAEAAAPSPSVLTAAVERRVLRQSVVLRGEVVAGQSFEVTPNAKGGGKSVVTAVRVKAGDPVASGSVLLEVGGRPLIALPGAKPAFRDLRPGYTGDDVRQLQSALKSLGYDPGEANGVFGSGTKTALTRLFSAVGYQAQPTGETDEAQLAAAAKQVRQAERAVADARDANDAKAAARAADDLAEARKAQADLVARTGPVLPLSEYLFLPGFPAAVGGLKAEVGAEVAAPAITLSSGDLRVRGVLNSEQKNSVKPGMAVEIASEVLGTTVPGTIESIGELRTDKTNPANNGYPLVVTPTKPLDRQLASQNVRLTVAAASTGGEVLVVPLSALFAGADGQVGVVRRSPDGREERIPVAPGLRGDGSVAVTGPLDPGDRVVIGVRLP
ncbi:hypothetical protein ASE03_15845 [Kitasatospora sp. Root187]|nr:hypothetical protein ASC99_18910 [Kitasatospora sp. Root107]KRB75445.1 hypothetical protein ASE03_15845 [Kitasatospora sp. Root187]